MYMYIVVTEDDKGNLDLELSSLIILLKFQLSNLNLFRMF